MRPDSDRYYCYQWCGRMRWARVRDATGKDCNWALVHSSGRIVPGQAESWDKYQQLYLYKYCVLYSLWFTCELKGYPNDQFGASVIVLMSSSHNCTLVSLYQVISISR
jgi:hypothetical protein